jgi:hypothetical protein
VKDVAHRDNVRNSEDDLAHDLFPTKDFIGVAMPRSRRDHDDVIGRGELAR